MPNRPCCIEIVRKRSAKEGVLLIKGNPVRASQRRLAVLACLHEEQGRVVPYERLRAILGHKSSERKQTHLLQQYMLWIRKTLAAHEASCMLGVVQSVGYVCANMAKETDASAPRASNPSP